MYDRSKERIIGQNYILGSAVKALKLSLWISHPDMSFNLANPRRLLRSDITGRVAFHSRLSCVKSDIAMIDVVLSTPVI
jgi:hypothetical protein